MLLPRRRFLRSAALTGLAAGTIGLTDRALALAPQRPAMLGHDDFSFVFLTDTHIQPELDASKGCLDCFRQVRSANADFTLQGGDHVFDALGVPKSRALSLMDLYKQTADTLGHQVYNTMGNHDVMGIYTKSGIEPSDPLYGKKYYTDNFGAPYYAFNHKGVHFVVLDSIGITADRSYEGFIDQAQIDWLSRDLAAMPAGMPVIVSTHIPLVTAVEDYAPPPGKAPAHQGTRVKNAWQVLELFDHYNVIGVFQGHTHVLETVTWHGVPYITGGAVSGNWWHGTRLGTPEGYLVVRVEKGRVIPDYVTYGFRTIDPKNT
ncbi:MULTISPECIES: metallophosphoesterase family protein [Asaia]|nr:MULTISPECIES: metallophosphoesterase [Asaia]ETC98229.1 metallophosphoesterase [Asaia sp. SF2.1]